MKKIKQLSPKVSRQLELLDKYYDIDKENRVITLTLHYKKASDLIDEELSLDKTIQIKQDVLVKISDVIDTFPIEFTTNVQLVIDDYEDYKKEEIVESLVDALEMFRYTYDSHRTKKWLQAAILIVIGIVTLYGLYSFHRFNWIADERMANMLGEIGTIVGWVFIWQAVSILFLEERKYNDINQITIARISHIELMNKKREIIFSKDQEALTKNWVRESVTSLSVRIIFLIAAVFLLSNIALNIINTIYDIYYTGFTLDIVFTIITVGSIVALNLFAAIGSISIFTGKGRYIKAIGAISIINLIIHTVNTILLFTPTGQSATYSNRVMSIISFGVSLILFASWITYILQSKKTNKKLGETKWKNH